MFRILLALLFASSLSFAGELEDQLFQAIREPNANKVAELLNNPDEKKRPNPSAKDKDGTPAIMEALWQLDPGHPLHAQAREAIFMALLRARPDLNARNAVGETVLIEAIRSLGGRAHIPDLLKAGANSNIPGRLWTPLFEAAMRGDGDVVRLLLEHEARVDEGEVTQIGGRPTKRRTPLMVAVEQGEGAVADLLYESGASLTRKDGNGRSVLDMIKEGKKWQNDELKRLTEREIVILEGLRPFLSKPLAKLVVGYAASPKMISAGVDQTCAIRTDQTLVCWGGTSLDQRKDMPAANVRFKSISLGHYHACGIIEDDSVACWGSDGFSRRKDLPAANVHFKSIAVGMSHACGIRQDDSVMCWGNDERGQRRNLPAANVHFKHIAAGTYHTCGIREDDSVACWPPSSITQKDQPEANVRFKTISVGGYHACGIRQDDSVTCWGDDRANQRQDLPAANVRFKSISLGAFHACGITQDGSVMCWGDDREDKRADLPGADIHFKSIAVGGSHACGITLDNQVVCWGNRSYSQRDGMPANLN